MEKPYTANLVRYSRLDIALLVVSRIYRFLGSNQLANDPLEILIDNHVIAHGEVVIVDGNFGVQITAIGTKRERLEQTNRK
jgi:hypothetical protein